MSSHHNKVVEVRSEEDAKVGADPLMALRHFTMHSKDIVETEEYIIFNSIAYSKSAKTNFPMLQMSLGHVLKDEGLKNESDSSKSTAVEDNHSNQSQEIKDDYYNVGSLKYFLDNSEIPHPQYVKRAVHVAQFRPYLQVVTRVDRIALLEYLQGRRSKCAGVDPKGPIALPLPAPKVEKRDYLYEDEAQLPHAYRTSKHKKPPIMAKVVEQSEKELESESLLTCISNRDRILSKHGLPNPRELFSIEHVGNVAKSLLDLNIKPTSETESQDTHSKPMTDEEDDKASANSIIKVIGSEKILELKAKRRAVKVHKVQHIPDVEFEKPTSMASAFSCGKKDNSNILLTFQHERVYNDRTTLLRSSKTSFFGPVVKILNDLKVKEDRIKKFGPAAATIAISPQKVSNIPSYKKSASAIEVARCKKLDPYSRYDQEAKLPLETDEFGIRPLETFSRGLGLVEGVKKAMSMENLKKASPPPIKKPRRDNLTPIIIVPDCPPSLITILNAKDILEDGRFVSNEEKKSSGVKKMGDIIIHHMKSNGGKSVPYKIISFPEKLALHDWERVVAVFVTGKSWQFKGWPWNANPVEICTRSNAFHMKYDDGDADPNIKQWPVQVINFNRDRRHLDKACVVGFWLAVESFISKNKPYLNY